MQEHLRVGIIGAGVLGNALGRLFSQHGYRIVAVASRRLPSARALAQVVDAEAVPAPVQVATGADLILLTLPDDQVAPVVADIARAGGFRPGQSVVHTSGALDLNVLAPAAERGAWTGSLHPFQSAADPDQAVRTLPGSAFGVEAAEPLRGILESIVLRVGGRPLRVTGEMKALYHVAAALASNGAVALFAAAADLLERAGIPPADSRQALLALLGGTLENLSRLGLPRALTGPIARGDEGTVIRHLRALARWAPDLTGLYCELGRTMVALAVEKGSLDGDGAKRILQALSDAEAATCA
jgi:predicted short-subunit dehydrogenase-like oxidoreductase (DUF2520 family)